MSDRVAHAAGEDFAVLAIPVHADDAANADVVIQGSLGRRRHVVGLAEGHVQLVVRPDRAGPGAVVEAFFARGHQLFGKTSTATSGPS